LFSGSDDPYSRIVHEYDDGTIRVCLKIPKELYMELIDIVDYLGLTNVEEGLKLAVESLQEKIFDKKTLARIKRTKRKPRKISIESKEIREIKNMISFITRMINDISNNIARAERVSNLITPIAPQNTQVASSPAKKDINIDLGELQVSKGTERKQKEAEKSLEDAIEDVLVVAMADEILKKEK